MDFVALRDALSPWVPFLGVIVGLTSLAWAVWTWRKAEPSLNTRAFFRFNKSKGIKEIKLACTAGRHAVRLRSVRLLRRKIGSSASSIVNPELDTISEELAREPYIKEKEQYISAGDTRVILYPLNSDLEGDARSGALFFRVAFNNKETRVPVSAKESDPLSFDRPISTT